MHAVRVETVKWSQRLFIIFRLHLFHSWFQEFSKNAFSCAKITTCSILQEINIYETWTQACFRSAPTENRLCHFSLNTNLMKGGWGGLVILYLKRNHWWYSTRLVGKQWRVLFFTTLTKLDQQLAWEEGGNNAFLNMSVQTRLLKFLPCSFMLKNIFFFPSSLRRSEYTVYLSWRDVSSVDSSSVLTRLQCQCQP